MSEVTSLLATAEMVAAAAEAADFLDLAQDETEVWAALVAVATGRLATPQSLVMRRLRQPGSDLWRFDPLFVSPGLPPVRAFESPAPLFGMGLVSAPPETAGLRVHQALFELIPGEQPGGVVYAAIDPDCVLLLMYRGSCPAPSPEFWIVLECVRQHAARALVRAAGTPPRARRSVLPYPSRYRSGACSSDA